MKDAFQMLGPIPSIGVSSGKVEDIERGAGKTEVVVIVIVYHTLLYN